MQSDRIVPYINGIMSNFGQGKGRGILIVKKYGASMP